MNKTCESFKMAVDLLLEFSLEDPSCVDWTTCYNSYLESETAPVEKKIHGWCVCHHQIHKHFIPVAVAPIKSKADDNKKVQTYRRPYIKQDAAPAGIQVPFKHHEDTSRYMREYRKYESFTMGQDTNVAVKYEIMGRSRDVYKQWSDQHGSLGVRGAGVIDDGKAKLSYSHSTSDKRPKQRINENSPQLSVKEPVISSHIKDKQTIPHEVLQDPNLSDEENKRNLQFVLTGSKSEGYSLAERKAKNKKKTTKLGSINTLPNNTNMAHNLIQQMRYGSMEEYYVKQIEQEFSETIEKAKERKIDKSELEGFIRAKLHIEPTVTKIPYSREQSVMEPDGRPIYVTPEPQQEMNLTEDMSTSAPPRLQVEPDKQTQVVQLPPIPQPANTTRADDTDSNNKVKHSFQRHRQKGVKVVEKKFTNSMQYMNLPSPRRHLVQENQNVPDYSSSSVHQSVPPLASVYSSQEELSSRPAGRNPKGSAIVLPKLHKWLSDTAVHRQQWEEGFQSPSDNIPDSSRNQKAGNNNRKFSQEFLEYANQLKNREVIMLLHDSEYRKAHSPQLDREVPQVQRDTQSLPETESMSHKYTMYMGSSTDPPPNTPLYHYNPYHDLPNQKQDSYRKSKSENSHYSKKHGPKLALSTVNIMHEPGKIDPRSNENVVEILTLPAVTGLAVGSQGGHKKYLSQTANSTDKPVWRG